MLRTRLIAGATSGVVLSAVVATALTVLTFGEALFEPWRVNPDEPAPITLRLPRTGVRVLDDAGTHTLVVTPVVPRGSRVTDPELSSLVREYEQSRRPPRPTRLLSHLAVYFLLVLMMTAYLRHGHARQGALLRTQVGLLLLALLFLVGDKALLLFTDLPALVVPVQVVPIWASLYLDRRTGILMSTLVAFLCVALAGLDPIACVVYLVSGALAATLVEQRKVKHLLPAGAVSGLGGALSYAVAKETFDGVSITNELEAGLRSGFVAPLIAGVAAGALAFVLRPVIARLLGVLSRGQLTNLTDLEQPLLRKMAAEAPGSWEHSRAMANLAEAAAAAIHADALLTRTGAYYHDLGKSCQSKYYVENLKPGEASPHDDLDPDVSADAIMAHVIEGARILREGGIPEPVVEFAYTHHGTSLIEYFFHKCLRQGNPKGLTEDAFRYPGMKPRTKETAILMLVDSIEAGARTVDPPAREGFEKLVERVIFSKMRQGQLDEAGLTIEDLRTLANQLCETLCSVYHSRIRYPWQDEEERKSAELARAAAEAGVAGDGADEAAHDDADPSRQARAS